MLITLVRVTLREPVETGLARLIGPVETSLDDSRGVTIQIGVISKRS